MLASRIGFVTSVTNLLSEANMTVEQLIEALSDYDSQQEVRIAFQPSWPLRATVAGVADLEEAAEFDALDTGVDPRDRVRGANRVFICANEDAPGDDSPYASKTLWEVAGQQSYMGAGW